MLSWDEIKKQVLTKEPKAGPLLAVVEQYWGPSAGSGQGGKLTEELAWRFITAFGSGQYAEAKRLLYGQMTPQQLVEADQAENERLAAWVDEERKVFNFLGDLEAAMLKVALGIALAAVGL